MKSPPPYLPSLVLCGLLALIMAPPGHSIDSVIKLYICQTEHELEKITLWEKTKPARYREAVKNGDRTPVDAARDTAGFLIATDRIRCDDNGSIVIEKYRSEGDTSSAYMDALKDAELERHCPRTLQQYGHPCR